MIVRAGAGSASGTGAGTGTRTGSERYSGCLMTATTAIS